MQARLLYLKALYVLDTGAQAEGEKLLRQSLELASLESDRTTTGSVLYALGELMYERGKRSEAELFLRRFEFMGKPGDQSLPEAPLVSELLSILTQGKPN